MSTIYKQRVDAGTTIFNVTASKPSRASNWGLDIMDGWKTTGEPTVISTELGSNTDGVALGDRFPVRQRFITLGGYVYAPTEADAEYLNDLLALTFPRNSSVKLVRYEATPKYAMVRRSTALETDWSAVQTGFRWNTTLLAEDPLLYGLTAQTATAGVAGLSGGGFTFPFHFPLVFTGSPGSSDVSAGILNSGTAESPRVTITLHGPLAAGGWRVRNDTTDEEFTIDVSLSSADVLVVDMHDKTAFMNGYALSLPLEGEYLTAIPGNNDFRLYADYDPGASITVVAESAWE